MPKKYREPKALRHLRRTLTEAMARKSFVEIFGRPPSSDTELEIYVEQYTLEMYNGGYDEWPELRKQQRPGSAT